MQLSDRGALFAARVRMDGALKRESELAKQIADLRERGVDTQSLEHSLGVLRGEIRELQERAVLISQRARGLSRDARNGG
jgi:hypothetical protein